MEFNKQLSPNLLLISCESVSFLHGELAVARFYFEFHGMDYSLILRVENVLRNIPRFEAEGDSELIDSFVNAMETMHWETLKQCWIEQVNWCES